MKCPKPVVVQAAMLAALIMVLPDATTAQTPGPPIGFYDVAVPTNCFSLNQPLQTPNKGYWDKPFPPPVFAPNGARLYARTVNTTDVVALSTTSSHVQVPSQLSLPTGGEDYHRTETPISLTEPNQPTQVTINAHSTRFPLLASKWNVVVYPRQSIQSVTLSPNKSVYNPGDNVTAIIKLPWTSGISTVRGNFHEPQYTKQGAGTLQSGMAAWSGTDVQIVNQPPTKTEIRLDFTMAFPDAPDLYNVQELPMKMQVSISGQSNLCRLTKSTQPQEIAFRVRNPNYSYCPQGQTHVQSSTFPICHACLSSGTAQVSGPAKCPLDQVYAQGYCIDSCGRSRIAPEKPGLIDNPDRFKTMPGPGSEVMPSQPGTTSPRGAPRTTLPAGQDPLRRDRNR